MGRGSLWGGFNEQKKSHIHILGFSCPIPMNRIIKKNPLKTLRYQKGWLLHYFYSSFTLNPKNNQCFLLFSGKKRVSFRRWYQVDQNFTVYWWYWLYMQWDLRFIYLMIFFKGAKKDLLSWEMKLSIVYFVVKIWCCYHSKRKVLVLWT